MVETITPVVYGGRARWAMALLLHVAGASATAALFGAGLGVLGSLLGAPYGRAGWVLVAAIAIAYPIGELMRRPLPVPQLRRQVPDWWRTFFPAPLASALYGAGLGVGFLTYLGHGTLVAVSVLAFSTGRPLAGALIVGPFGLARGLSVLRAAAVHTTEEGRRLVEALGRSPEVGRSLANGIVLSALALVLALEAWVSPAGSWAELAGAVLGLAFAWSASAKVLVYDRWVRTLAGRRLPRWLERVARRGVPLAEALVPVGMLLGFGRIAAWWGSILLVGFSIELIRTGLRVGARVPCGCFGGRRSLDVRVALIRNGVLGAVAALAATAPSTPKLEWPGIPTSGEILPMVLASVGAVVAGLTAWRASVWLGREARA